MKCAFEVRCKKELGRWTVRVNGFYVADFWRSKPALEMVDRLLHVGRAALAQSEEK